MPMSVPLVRRLSSVVDGSFFPGGDDGGGDDGRGGGEGGGVGHLLHIGQFMDGSTHATTVYLTALAPQKVFHPRLLHVSYEIGWVGPPKQ